MRTLVVRTAALLTLGATLACADSSVGPGDTTACATPDRMAVGEVRELSGAAALSCFVVASTSTESEFVYIAANTTPEQDDVRPVLVEAIIGDSLVVTPGNVASATPAAAIGAPRLAIAAQEAEPLTAGTALEERVRRAERRLLAGRSLATLEAAARRQAVPQLRAPAASMAVGDTALFRVPNAASSTSLCTDFREVRARIVGRGTRVTIAQDIAAAAGGFTEADFAQLVTEFDAVVFPVVSSWFGSPSDVNGDGRITVLFTPEINKLTPPGSLGFAGGFFFMGDLLPRAIPSEAYSCPQSNEQEILYLLSPDPTGQVNGNRFPVENTRESARGTTAHELQHMISQGVRQQVSRAAQLEVAWLNEGLSHFAEEVVGRAMRGYGDRQRLDWTDLLRDLDDFDSYFRQNLLRYRFWMQRPDLASPVSALANSQLAPRGAAWAFVRYAVDQFGGTDGRAFTRALVAGPEVDVANFERRAGVPFSQLVPGFLLASLGDIDSPGFAPRYRFASLDIRDVMEELSGGSFPLRVETLPARADTEVRSGSGSYYRLRLSANAPAATFRLLSRNGGSVTFAGARAYVTRVR